MNTVSLIEILFIPLAIIEIISLVYQYKYMRSVMHKKSLLYYHLALIGAAIVFPILASIVGDLQGAKQFGDEPYWEFLSSLMLGLFMLGSAITFLSFGNMVYIATKGRVAFLNIVGWIFYGILWLALLFITYFVYSLVYTSHDPNTE